MKSNQQNQALERHGGSLDCVMVHAPLGMVCYVSSRAFTQHLRLEMSKIEAATIILPLDLVALSFHVLSNYH